MKHTQYVKRSSVKKYFPMPNEIFGLGLHYCEIAIYAYLMRIEDRNTHQCYPSYKTIGKNVQMSPNTVSKYVRALEGRGLIRTEHTHIFTNTGLKHNGTLLYTILPIKDAVKLYHDRQLAQAELVAAQQKAKQRTENLGVEFVPPDSERSA